MEIIDIIKPDKQKLKTYYFRPQDAYKYILIVCHGFRGTKENSGKIYSFAGRLNQLGFGVAAFDFSGSGESDGSFDDITLSGQAKDLCQVIDYMYKKYNKPIILLGRSFGGSTVLAGGAADKRIAGYIFWSTPVKMQETFARMLDEDYEQLLKGKTINLIDEVGEYTIKPDIIRDFDEHNMIKYLSALGNRPVLVIHGLEDEVVDYSNAEEIKNYTQNSSIYLVEKAAHRFTNKTVEREDITIRWLADRFVVDGGVD